MTYHEKIKFLESYRHCIKTIKSLEREIEEWETIATNITQKITPVIVNTNENHSKVETCAIKCAEVSNQLNHEIYVAMRKRNTVLIAIENINDSRKQDLMRMRYINGLSVSKIADILEKDEDNIYKQIRNCVKSMNI